MKVSKFTPICWPNTPEERERREKIDVLRNEAIEFLHKRGHYMGDPVWEKFMRPFLLEYSLRDHAFLVEDDQ